MRSIESLCRVIGVASIVVWAGCGQENSKLDKTTSQSPMASAVADGWEWYEDAVIRFQHPTERKVVPLPRDPKGYFVMEPGDLDGLPGPESITIFPDNESNGVSLREIALDHVKDAAREQTKLLGNLANVVLAGGHCVSYVMEGPNIGGCTTPDGDKPVCRRLSLRSECETDRKVRFEVNSSAEAYPDAGKPSSRAREQIQVFERLVKSIEFKK